MRSDPTLYRPDIVAGRAVWRDRDGWHVGGVRGAWPSSSAAIAQIGGEHDLDSGPDARRVRGRTSGGNAEGGEALALPPDTEAGDPS